MPLAVASRYAKAFVDLLFEGKAEPAPEAAVDQLRRFEESYSISAELRNILLSPAVTPARKRAVVARLGADLDLAKTVRNFLYVLIDRRRIGVLKEVRAAVETEIDRRRGVVRADIASARKLEEAQRAVMQAKLSELSGKQVIGRFRVDPDLLGGAVARIGSRIYDGSVRGQLETLRRRLAAD